MTLDEIYRRIYKKEEGYVDLKLWTERGIFSVTLKGEERKRAKDLLKSLKSFKGVVWFGAPDIENCPVELWDSEEKEFYSLCRGRDGKWYLSLPGSYQGRSTTNYYRVDEEKALGVLKEVEKFFPGKSPGP